jgi:large subunit ribosomal protein L17
LITVARSNDLPARRRLISKIKDRVAVEKLLTVLAPRYESRAGGYTRIIKAGFRFGDMAPVAYIELIDRDVAAKGKSDLSSNVEVNKQKVEVYSPVKEKKESAVK